MSPAGMKDVADRAGVSVGTVSNVLNRPGAVSDRTRERVVRAIEELGFVRNESARLLRNGHSRTVAYVIFDPSNPFFTDVAKGAEDAARAAGLVLYIASSSEDRDREAEHLDVLLEHRVRGVLITPLDRDGERLRKLPRQGVPVVLVDRAAQDPSAWCSVAVDDVEGGDLAVDHLVELGHTRIAFVGGPVGLPQVADRLAGARQALERAGLPPGQLTVVETAAPTVAEGRLAGQKVIGMPARRRPTAAFCANDLLALGFLQQMTQHGLRVPSDMSIVGYDDIDFAAAAAVPLTSVRQPRYELGHRACELLLAEASARNDPDGGRRHVHEQVEFQPNLVVRASSGPPGSRGPTDRAI
ncbi:MAG TPA: LacI family DNA-binding transcriptional regulator [Dermatophilaceae bacterium]|nr:LacI family DNA-binding transcriptional regulator [Dermatophilaceae bacterium]